MRRCGPILLLLLTLPLSARADLTAVAQPPAGALCRPAIAAAERAADLPPQLMQAIARVESGRSDPATHAVGPWPWTINAEGRGSFFDTRAAAIAAVQELQARGVRSIDVGCMQVNLMHHPAAFASLDEAFDPAANARYAAKFLGELHVQTNDWPRAVALYHSATPGMADDYQRKVLAAWPEERRLAGNPALAVPASAGVTAAPRFSIPATLARGGVSVRRDLASYRAAPVLSASRAPPGLGG